MPLMDFNFPNPTNNKKYNRLQNINVAVTVLEDSNIIKIAKNNNPRKSYLDFLILVSR